MSIIQVSCIDQVLTPTSTPVIASGGIKEDSVAFRFCSQWDGFYKTAVFWQQEQQPYHVLLDENNSCLIPAEVLTDEGTIYFGVFGVNDDGVQRTSNVLRYTIERGTITTNTQPSDPTPDVYTQLLAAIAALGDNAGKADKVSNATEGNLASLDANGNLQDSGRKPGAAGGVATLDSDGKVPSGQLPAMDYIPTSQKGEPGGVATLDSSDGKLPVDELPITGAIDQLTIASVSTGAVYNGGNTRCIRYGIIHVIDVKDLVLLFDEDTNVSSVTVDFSGASGSLVIENGFVHGLISLRKSGNSYYVGQSMATCSYNLITDGTLRIILTLANNLTVGSGDMLKISFYAISCIKI